MPGKRKRQNAQAGPSSVKLQQSPPATDGRSGANLGKTLAKSEPDEYEGPPHYAPPRRSPRREDIKLLEPDTTVASTIKPERLPVSSEDEAESERPRSPTKRRKLPAMAYAENESESTPRQRLNRKGSESLSERAEEGNPSIADSADIDDLQLSTPPPPSKPTAKEVKRAALQELKFTRQNKSSPTTRKNIEDTEGLESSSSDSQTDESEPDAQSEGLGSFIVEAPETVEATEALEAALGPEYHARRGLDQHFTIFVHYLVRLCFDPDFLSVATTSDSDRWYFEAAINAVRQRTDAIADSLLLSTWPSPFTFTLDSRPILVGPVQSEDSSCQACWTRGEQACSATGCYTLSTRKGFYNTKTFQAEPENDVEYCRETTEDFENSAVAPKLRYPPGFRLVVGARCARRAAAYHQARHYLYNTFIRVKDEIERLCNENDEFASQDVTILPEGFTPFAAELLNDFELDRTQWNYAIPSSS
ncbi:hypothetical protein C8R46DRAFT_1063912 [Mycena filopes]|nr:hypothetical protein C8R46DRAFT_1063912 [Mycena filopes]